MTDRPLWQLLMELKTAVPVERPFSCTECFSILEYLAEAFNKETAVARQEQLHEIIKQHLAVCPDCRAHYLERLAALERLLKKQPMNHL